MKNIGKIVRIAKPLYHLVAILGILILVGALLELVTPIFSKLIIDEIVKKISGTGASVNRLIFLIALAFGLNFFGIIVTVVSERIGDHFGGRLRKFLIEKFYEKVLSLPQSYFDSEVSGKILNQLSRGIDTIRNVINAASNFILPMFLQSVFTIIVMAFYSGWVAFFTFILFPIYLLISYYSTKKWGEREVEKNIIEDYSRGRIQEVIGNIKLVKSFNSEKNEYETVSRNLQKSNEIYAKQSQAFHVYDFFRNLSLNIVLLAINAIVFYNTYIGKLTIGEMVLIIQLVNQARRPLFAMSFILTQIQMAESGSKEFFEILSIPSSEKIDLPIPDKKITNPSIEFKHVSFKYEQSKTVLEDISFTMHAKERVALVGHSGVGKSTIVNLILKFYTPTVGEIFLKGKSYAELDHRTIRNNIALVFQENELFSSTIQENVAYGSKATEDEVIQALKLANAWDFVQKLPKGIESQVGERGVRLSGGQKQRIQIARAILKNSPILILDEATSSLDSKSEREVQVALENLMKDKLVIIIAHRFSTIQNVHKIIVVDEGKIVDYGNPQELSKRKGVYSDLLNYQIEGNKKLLEQFEIY